MIMATWAASARNRSVAPALRRVIPAESTPGAAQATCSSIISLARAPLLIALRPQDSLSYSTPTRTARRPARCGPARARSLRQQHLADPRRRDGVPRPTSTSVPTMLRTMWRRKPSPRDIVRDERPLVAEPRRDENTTRSVVCVSARRFETPQNRDALRARALPRPSHRRRDGPGHVPGVGALERTQHSRVPDAVAIGLCAWRRSARGNVAATSTASRTRTVGGRRCSAARTTVARVDRAFERDTERLDRAHARRRRCARRR